LLRDERLVSVTVSEAGASKPFLEVYRSVSVTAPSRTVSRAIRDRGKEIGSVAVTFSLGPDSRRYGQVLETLFVGFLVSSVVSVVLVLLVFHFRLLLPVMRLHVDLRKLARGELEPRNPKWSGTEELRLLAEGIARAGRLQAAMRQRARRDGPTAWPQSTPGGRGDAGQ
jgi:hypothetical protein